MTLRSSSSVVCIVSTVSLMPVARSVYEKVAVYVRSPFGMLGGSQVTVREESVIISIRLVTGLGTGGGRSHDIAYSCLIMQTLEAGIIDN